MMDIADITTSMRVAPAAAPGVPGPSPGLQVESFESVLEQAARDEDRATVRASAAQLVSSTFIMPVLNAMHESPFMQEPFAPGFAEKRFMPLLNQKIADRITQAANFPLVDLITDRLLGPQEKSS